MERKRKLPARAARVEAVSKKRTSTPPEPRTQTPTPPVFVEESLPKSLAPGKPLPTVEEPQSEDLSSRDFQSVAESGVLAESLKRSRQTWTNEGIFEKYWTKITKKKGGDVANNPAKESMTKLGTCTITVEPHIIEAVMYAIKEPARSAPPLLNQQPMHRPIIQYGPPNGMMPPPTPTPPTPTPPPPPPPAIERKPTPPQPIPQPPAQSEDTHMTNSTNPPVTNVQSTTQSPNRCAPNSHHPPPNSNNPPPNAPPGKSTDPVIQMLAERAASDPDLKALMRIVANGEATPEELKRFQSHIDDLTRLQKARQAAAQTSQCSSRPVPPGPATPQATTKTPKPSPNPPPQKAAPAPAPQYQPQPQALRSKGPLPPSKPDISGVVFEFVGGNGDRYLFPRFSILEYLPQGQVIASFLIVRKGSSSDSPTYDPELDYYQPITIRLYAHQGRQLEALQKVVAPQEEVRRYMDDIMDNMTRAEYVLLAMRLPKEPELDTTEKVPEAQNTIQMDNQVLWATTNPSAPPAPAPPPPKAKDRLLSEEEKYQAFIATVS